MKRLIFFSIPFFILSIAFYCRADTEKFFEEKRKRMVEEQIIRRGVKDTRVIDAMLEVPRHRFVLPGMENAAYEDTPLPIGYGQTISQPYIVAFMTEALDLKEGDKVLEIGTGSGYQAAVLAEMGCEVYSIEIIPELAEEARRKLNGMRYQNVTVRCGDGYMGWEEEAPFDAIIVTAAPPGIPQNLVDQLKEGGRMVAPVGTFSQELYLITKTKDGVKRKSLLPVRFVPMVPGR
ncbi:MAG: protein-L-isoaspartate(D-aspartate) O-methyltransferase [Candidatus Omnitrophota bacterium]